MGWRSGRPPCLRRYHRFVAAAVAPLASTIVVMASYLAFAVLDGRAIDRVPGDASALVSRSGLLILAGGTTLGVLVLALIVLVPLRTVLRHERVRIRPTLRFPDRLGPVARRLALAGVAGLASQQVAVLAMTWIANHEGGRGTVTLFSWTFAVFAVPFAVLLAPIATSAFPRVSSELEQEAGVARGALGRLVDTSLRTTLLAAGAGAALLAGTSHPVAAMFTSPDQGESRSALAAALLAVAPGLWGYGVLTLCTRFLAAQRRSRLIAATNASGWLSAVAAAFVMAAAADPDRVVVALAGGMAAGLTIGGLAAVSVTAFGPHRVMTGVAGLVRPMVVGVLGAVGSGMVGLQVADAVVHAIPTLAAGLVGPTVTAVVTAIAVVAVYAVIVAAADRPDARRLLAVVRRGRTPSDTDAPTTREDAT